MTLKRNKLNSLKILKKCRICNSVNFKVFLKLTDTPLEDQFLYNQVKQPSYPLEVAMCKNCFYVFLPHVISPEISYDEYIYESAVTIGLEKHYETYAQEIVKKFKITSNSLAIDIGSNDGSMLRAFQKEHMKILGVEPAKQIANFANQKKLNTINSFFSLELANKIVLKEGKASIITANYMFANIDDLEDFILGVKVLLDDDGIFIIQTGYHPVQFSKNLFDYIYHEHFSYFTIHSLTTLFKKFNLEIVDAKIINPKGGSIRIAINKIKNNNNKSFALKKIILDEEKHNYNSSYILTLLNKNINKEKDKLITQLKIFKEKNIKIAGIGASHSTTTLIYHFELQNYIEFLVDDNIKKHNTYSPGLHIKVFDSSYLKESNIQCLLILGWQHQEIIIKKFKPFLQDNRFFIVPLPQFRIVK